MVRAQDHKPGVGGSNPPLATNKIMKMYCITIKDNHYEKINKLGYLPVGLGKTYLHQNLF